jgi:hypothetical protein
MPIQIMQQVPQAGNFTRSADLDIVTLWNIIEQGGCRRRLTARLNRNVRFKETHEIQDIRGPSWR